MNDHLNKLDWFDDWNDNDKELLQHYEFLELGLLCQMAFLHSLSTVACKPPKEFSADEIAIHALADTAYKRLPRSARTLGAKTGRQLMQVMDKNGYSVCCFKEEVYRRIRCLCHQILDGEYKPIH